MKKILVILAFFLLASCHNKPVYNLPPASAAELKGKAFVHIHGMSPLEASAVHEAINTWNDAMNSHFVFIPVSSLDVVEDKIGKRLDNDRCYDIIDVKTLLPTHPDVIKRDKKKRHTKTAAFTSYYACHVSRVKLIPFRADTYWDLVWTSMHELGHAVGLKHNDVPETLMFKKFTPMIRSGENCCVQKIDAAAFCEMLKCDVESTSYCIH